MRLVFASCQPAAADRARAVRPASSRISRRRSASSCRARWTLDDGETAMAKSRSGGPVLVVRDGAFPGSFECVPAQFHDGRVVRQFVLDDLSVAGEVMEAQQAVVE